VTLPHESVFSQLRSDFIVGWKNIKKEPWRGQSHGYTKRQTCVGTTNGAGAHNVQIFILAPDTTVLHALPGFWHPEDLARELRFAKVLWRLWGDDTRTLAQKRRMFRSLQLAEAAYDPAETVVRSGWQGFDASIERARAGQHPRDTFLVDSAGKPVPGLGGAPRMKPLNVLVHDRMAQRPFVKFRDFDVEAFVDYGLSFYDNNLGVDRRHKRFPNPRQ